MFVAKYPDWVAEIMFPDGYVVFFDGAKDLFKYYFKMEKYDPRRSRQEITAIFVTEYYDLKLIDAQAAFYVIGSNVYGPMGHELIPFASEADAQEFMKDHQGKKIVRFKEISPELIAPLD
jgi:nitrous oxide reductase accessory protein NosL